jgi:uncharacterized protein (TIGR01777 family)
MRIAVTGSSGLIGTALLTLLDRDGHSVVRLVRHRPRQSDEAQWDPQREWVGPAALAGCDAVVHLAGAPLGDRRWTKRCKQVIRDSRVRGTTAIARAIAAMDNPPSTLLVGTAIGYYGETGDQVIDEDAPPGEGFLAGLCREWEAAASAALEAGVRTVFARTGLVVARGGGAWGRLFPLFRAGLGGRFWAAGASTGVTSRWTTTSPRCGTCSSLTTCPGR